MLYYTCEDDCSDLLTVDGVKKAWKYEKYLTKHHKYPKTCLATSNVDSSCKPSGSLSISEYFDTELNAGTLNQGHIDAFKFQLLNTPSTWDKYKSLIGQYFTSAHQKTKYLVGQYLL